MVHTAAVAVIEADAVLPWAPAVFPVTGVGSSASYVATSPIAMIAATSAPCTYFCGSYGTCSGQWMLRQLRRMQRHLGLL